ncbi:hypothetical protein BDF19DRAFT_453071 [Syncephalis fuscata]|nr:hypothetical protein BDF19DRAFT_453071 [Syncephalis fuscata]
MYCENAQKLVLEAKRTTVDRLPPFNREMVQAVCRELRHLSDNIQEHLEKLTANYASTTDKMATNSFNNNNNDNNNNAQPAASSMSFPNTFSEDNTAIASEQASNSTLAEYSTHTVNSNDESQPSYASYSYNTQTEMEGLASSASFVATTPQDNMNYPNTEWTSSTIDERGSSLEASGVNKAHQSVERSAVSHPRPLEPWQYLKMTMEHLALKRNKRCLMTYLHHRLYIIRLDAWRRGGRIPISNTTENADIATRSTSHIGNSSGGVDDTRLDGGEEVFRRDYGRLLRRHAAQYANIGLLDELKPPKELYVQVRAIRQGGLVQTEGGGALRLEPGTQCYISRQEAERLIGLGLVHRV